MEKTSQSADVFSRHAKEHRLPVCVRLDLATNRFETGRVVYGRKPEGRVYTINICRAKCRLCTPDPGRGSISPLFYRLDLGLAQLPDMRRQGDEMDAIEIALVGFTRYNRPEQKLADRVRRRRVCLLV